MNRFRERRYNSRRPQLILWWLGVITVLLFVLDRQALLEPVKAHSSRVLAPVSRTLGSVRASAGSWFNDWQKGSDPEQENVRLKQEITRLQNENLALRGAEVENQRLRRTAGLKDRYGWQTITSNVVARSPDSALRTLTVDRGSNDGLLPGMAVISHVNGSPDALIGLIDDVQADSASVLLITDVNSVISGYVLHRDSESNVLSQPTGEIWGQWQLGSRLLMRKIERDAKLTVGDDVLTAGISREIGVDMPVARVPANIPIGKVTTFHPEGNMQVADIQPYFDPEQVQLVWIIVGVD